MLNEKYIFKECLGLASICEHLQLMSEAEIYINQAILIFKNKNMIKEEMDNEIA